VILMAVRWYLRHPLSATNVMELLAERGIDVSNRTVLRWVQTILVDMDTHRIVDLLEDPSADALVEWLGKHPGTEVICRDRDGVYASAARPAGLAPSAPNRRPRPCLWLAASPLNGKTRAVLSAAIKTMARRHTLHFADRPAAGLAIRVSVMLNLLPLRKE
jgi:hypothetical protein